MRRLLLLSAAVACSGLTIGRADVLKAAALSAAATAASLAPRCAVAAPSWDPMTDFMVGPEKNAISDYEIVPSQMAGVGKIDVNNALVTDYKQLPGMFPHAAGLIASHGPYNSVGDLFKISEATSRDKELFKQYRSQLVALPPGRQFYERINGRQST